MPAIPAEFGFAPLFVYQGPVPEPEPTALDVIRGEVALLADFKRALFGHRLEKSDPEQFELALEYIETAIASIHAESAAVDPPKSGPPSLGMPTGAHCPNIYRASRK